MGLLLRSGGIFLGGGMGQQNNAFSRVATGLAGPKFAPVSICVSNIHSIWLVVAGKH
jgi:hypothetical protein